MIAKSKNHTSVSPSPDPITPPPPAETMNVGPKSAYPTPRYLSKRMAVIFLSIIGTIVLLTTASTFIRGQNEDRNSVVQDTTPKPSSFPTKDTPTPLTTKTSVEIKKIDITENIKCARCQNPPYILYKSHGHYLLHIGDDLGKRLIYDGINVTPSNISGDTFLSASLSRDGKHFKYYLQTADSTEVYFDGELIKTLPYQKSKIRMVEISDKKQVVYVLLNKTGKNNYGGLRKYPTELMMDDKIIYKFPTDEWNYDTDIYVKNDGRDYLLTIADFPPTVDSYIGYKVIYNGKEVYKGNNSIDYAGGAPQIQLSNNGKHYVYTIHARDIYEIRKVVADGKEIAPLNCSVSDQGVRNCINFKSSNGTKSFYLDSKFVGSTPEDNIDWHEVPIIVNSDGTHSLLYFDQDNKITWKLDNVIKPNLTSVRPENIELAGDTVYIYNFTDLY